MSEFRPDFRLAPIHDPSREAAAAKIIASSRRKVLEMQARVGLTCDCLHRSHPAQPDAAKRVKKVPRASIGRGTILAAEVYSALRSMLGSRAAPGKNGFNVGDSDNQ